MFLVSGPDLVVETCRSGMIGTFPALNQRTSQGYSDWLAEIKERLESACRRRAVRHQPDRARSNPRVEADLKITVEHKVPLVITSLGAVADLVKAVHAYGGLVFHDVIGLRHAEKAAEAGVDGIIAVAAGAGGHAGTIARSRSSPRSGVLRQDHHPVGRDLERRADRGGARDGRGPRLSRHPLHRHRARAWPQTNTSR